ncbi:TPA: hypothetical protein CPT90_04455 [Candidatus Gastranaerophilales bacterium HUM_3]|nr:DUF4422 domain-containing protein [Acinetobacter sp.]DAA84649.1 MAG TPA: hypothetical protein CPT90_04455 [Candidatus Gastranaerophilales bacterium HUM_3]
MSDDEYSRALLDEYKKYDNVNENRTNPLIKILVSYIKPSFLFKSEILTPIHLGRAVERDNSKDGVITDDDIRWLHENCIGDDDFEENISAVNRRVGFLTGTYWAWKNYEKLGNPDYFGSFGYRKFIAPTFISSISNVDIIAPQKVCFNITLKEQFICSHGIELYNAIVAILDKVYPSELPLFNEYFEQKSGYFHELYVMKKNYFFEFCQWIFKLLFIMLSVYNNSISLSPKQHIVEKLCCKFLELNQEEITEVLSPRKNAGAEIRDIAFILERLTGFYIYKLSKGEKCKIIEAPLVLSQDFIDCEKNVNSLIISKMRDNIRKDIMHTMR